MTFSQHGSRTEHDRKSLAVLGLPCLGPLEDAEVGVRRSEFVVGGLKMAWAGVA